MPRARISFGVIAMIVYLWVIHSYKLALGDAAIAAALVAVVVRPGKLKFPPPFIFLTFFLAWAALGLLVSANRKATYDELVLLFKVLVVVFALFNGVQSGRELRILVIAWLGVFALYPLRGAYYNQFICHCNPAGRVSWNFVFANPNDLAALCFLPLGLALCVSLVERKKLWRNLALGGIIFLGLLIFLTQSRGAIIALAVTALWALMSRRRTRDVLVLAVASIVVWFTAPQSVWDRLGGLGKVSVQRNMKGVDDEDSAESRWLVWKVAMSVIESAPVTGVGLGMYPTHHAARAPLMNQARTTWGPRDTHSTYLRIAAETGIVGLLLYLSMCFSTFVYVGRIRKSIRHTKPREYQALSMLQLSLSALLIAAFFGSFGVFIYAYLHFGVVLLIAEIFKSEPWPVPASLSHAAGQMAEGSLAGATRLSARRSY